jgi:hypothetical protein
MVKDRAHIILKTLDIGETIQWYTASGFELRDQFPAANPLGASWRGATS